MSAMPQTSTPIAATTEAARLSDIGPDWCVVASLPLSRDPWSTVWWEWNLGYADRKSFAELKNSGKIITVTGRNQAGDMLLYAKLAGGTPGHSVVT